MGIVKEFKEFIIKGNMIDMAVGIIIGAAFGVVVKSLVADIIMPPVGAMLGGVDFSELKFGILEAVPANTEHPVTGLVVEEAIPPVTINYGLFINALITLLIQGIAIFVLVKFINKMKRKEEETPKEAPKPSEDIVLLAEIRDLMKQQQGG